MHHHYAKPPSLNAIPLNWGYNPSGWFERTRIAIVAAVGFLIASYMSLYQMNLIGSVWDPVFGEGTAHVLKSDLSHALSRVFRVPDALLGALAYLGDIVLGLGGSTRRWQFRPWLVLLFAVNIIPLGLVSALLVVSQGAVVGAWCFLCLTTAGISLLLIYLAYDEIWTTIRYLHGVWKLSGSWSVLWKTLIGTPTDAGRQVGEEMIGRS
jgi:uncharacterized membrane protein